VIGLLAACSGEPDEIVLLPSSREPGAGQAAEPEPIDIGTQRETAPRPRKIHVVKSVQAFRDESFIQRFIRKENRAVDLAFGVFKKIVAFPPRDGSPKNLSFSPGEVKIMRDEMVKAVQRASHRGKRQFAEDLEVFTLFQAAFNDMTANEKDELLEKWQDTLGDREPNKPISSVYPFYWLREPIQLWTAGVQDWWWAWHGLKEDPAFNYSRETGATFRTPEGAEYRSMKRR